MRKSNTRRSFKDLIRFSASMMLAVMLSVTTVFSGVALADDGTETTTTEVAMSNTAIGGVTYYYAKASDDAAATYTFSITTGRGASAVTTPYSYTLQDLTELGTTDYYYIVKPGSTELTGTLYGYGAGTTTSYTDIYKNIGVTAEGSEYDAVSSATTYSSFHAKDISGIAAYGTDADGNKALIGANLQREVKTVDAAVYVTASILKAAGEEITEEQTAALDITLKKNPMNAPASDVTPVVNSASYATSKYGTGEFVIVPDDTVEGYVWSEYWDNVYAATISDGTTTVGAVHWVDMYGEDATSGGHYNKLEIALNNGTSVGANAANVTRYAAFYDENTGNLKAGTYTVNVYAEGYATLTAEITVPEVAMSSVSVGGVTYYYADTTDADAMAVYTVSVTQGRGPSATTTVYNYTKANLKQVGESNIYYIVAPGATELEGTLYGYGEGSYKSYKDVYADLQAECDVDAVSSATHFTSYHAKDISSLAAYGTDAEGNKTLVGVNLQRAAKTVDAADYVNASILKAAGVELTEEQTAALNITLKKNPTKAPSETTITPVVSSAAWTTSRYGLGEFTIVPDDTVEGYVWSEYWDSVYAATISDGTTTVGAVHWIDMYGEDATSGPHYNTIEIALNNGTSVGANAAEVTRYASFFDTDNNLKPGTYTITVYSEGYTPLTASVTIKNTPVITLQPKTAVYTGKAVSIDAAVVNGSDGQVTYNYYTDAECTKEVAASKVVNAGTYYVTATVAETDTSNSAVSEAVKLVINKATPTVTLTTKTYTYNGKAKAIGAAVVKTSTGKVTYKYYTDSKCTKAVAASKVVNAGTYYVKATVAATANTNSATSKAVKLTIKKASQTLKVTASSKTVKYANLKKKAQTVALISKVTGAKTTVTYSKAAGSSKLTVNSKTGKVTLKKASKKGTYTIKIKVYAKASTNYNAASVTKTLKITVK